VTAVGLSRDEMIGGLKAPYAPVVLSDAEVVFPASVLSIMAPWSEIPKEFHRGRTKWNELQARWFYEGLPEGTNFRPKDGISTDAALRHLKAILGSFQPKHEHKEACVAYLMSLWFEDIVVPCGGVAMSNPAIAQPVRRHVVVGPTVREQIAAGSHFNPEPGTCLACGNFELESENQRDKNTGLCRPCWRQWRWSSNQETQTSHVETVR
jgi:hypothetical protein